MMTIKQIQNMLFQSSHVLVRRMWRTYGITAMSSLKITFVQYIYCAVSKILENEQQVANVYDQIIVFIYFRIL